MRIKKKLKVHMDGARFANALVSLDVTPAELTWKAGIDILSFGATKNGCIAAEAIIIFKSLSSLASFKFFNGGAVFLMHQSSIKKCVIL